MIEHENEMKHTIKTRSASEQVETATPESFQNRTCIWRALCRVFYEMQFGSADAPVETHNLLSALGVDNKFEQSDAQEIHRRLLDALQEAFERRPSVRCDGANPVAQIFEGKIVTSIRSARIGTSNAGCTNILSTDVQCSLCIATFLKRFLKL